MTEKEKQEKRYARLLRTTDLCTLGASLFIRGGKKVSINALSKYRQDILFALLKRFSIDPMEERISKKGTFFVSLQQTAMEDYLDTIQE